MLSFFHRTKKGCQWRYSKRCRSGSCCRDRYSGNRKLIEHRINGLLVPTQDPKSIAAALLEVFDKPSEAIARSAAARI